MRHLALLTLCASLLFFLSTGSIAAEQAKGRTAAAKTENSPLQTFFATEAQLRPALLQSGFGIPEEFDPNFAERLRHYSFSFSGERSGPDLTRSTLHIINALSAFAPFPAVKDRLQKGLFEEAVPLDVRLARFNGQVYILTVVADAIYTEKNPDRSWGLDLRRILGKWTQDDSYDGKTLRKDLPAKKALADAVMTRLLRFMEESAPAARLTAATMPSAPWYFPPQTDRDRRDDNADQPFFASAKRAALILTNNRANPAFVKKAEMILADAKAPSKDRLDALSTLAAAPDISPEEAIQRAPFRDDLAAFDKIWAGSLTDGLFFAPSHAAYAKLEKTLLAQALAAGQLPVSERAPTDNGRENAPRSGISLTRIGPPPASFTAEAPLYLLFPKVKSQDGEAYGIRKRIQAEGIRIFGSSLLASVDGPVLMPINPNRTEDAALLVWYAAGGSSLGKALLLASFDEPKKLARRMAAWHLWVGHGDAVFDANAVQADASKQDGDKNRAAGNIPRLLTAHPCEGSLLLALFPNLEGEAAALFMGREEAIWFAVPEEDGTVWYKAENPDAAKAPGASDKPAPSGAKGKTAEKPAAPSPAGPYALSLDAAMTARITEQAKAKAAVLLAYHLSSDFGGESLSAALAFYREKMPMLEKAAVAAGCETYDAPTLLKLLWLDRGKEDSDTLRWLTKTNKDDKARCRERMDYARRSFVYKEGFQL